MSVTEQIILLIISIVIVIAIVGLIFGLFTAIIDALRSWIGLSVLHPDTACAVSYGV